MAKHTRRRMPKLSYTESQGIGYYAGYRDSITNTPRRKRFGMIPEDEAKIAYTQWLAEYMAGNGQAAKPKTPGSAPTPLPPHPTTPAKITKQPLINGCLIAVANSLLRFEESRTRAEDAVKAPGPENSIDPARPAPFRICSIQSWSNRRPRTHSARLRSKTDAIESDISQVILAGLRKP